MKKLAVLATCLAALGGCASVIHDSAEHNARQECREIPNTSDRIECERRVHDREIADRSASRPEPD